MVECSLAVSFLINPLNNPMELLLTVMLTHVDSSWYSTVSSRLVDIVETLRDRI